MTSPSDHADAANDIGQGSDETGLNIGDAECFDNLRQEEAQAILRDVQSHIDAA